VEESAPQPVSASPSTPAAPIGFSNRRAVRITLSVAGFSLLAIPIFASISPALIVLILFAAGFISVRVYLSRTAENLTASGGATLGAMTCLWLSLVQAIGALFAFLTGQNRELIKTMKTAMKTPDLAQLVDDPQKFAIAVVAGVIMLLVIGTVFAAFGGIVAVRLQPRGGSSH
jgi:hypothetical protein